MQNKVTHILLLFTLLFAGSVTSVWAVDQSDRSAEIVSDSVVKNTNQLTLKDEQECLEREQELRAKLLTENGEKLLDTYATLFDLLTYMGAVDKQIELSENYLQEAERQNNIKAMRYARITRFYELYNNSYYTDMARVIEDDLAFYVKTKQWQAYYSEWTLYLQACLMRGRFSSALYGAQKMWDEAQKGNNNFGRGCSRFLIARVNKEMGQDDLAERDLLKAIKYLKTYLKYDDNTLMDAYNILFDLYFETGKYHKMVKSLNDAIGIIEDWSSPHAAQFENEYVYNDRLVFVYSYYVRAYLGLGEKEKAKELLDKAKKINYRMSETLQPALQESEAIYNQRVGNYAKAIEIYKNLMDDYAEGQDSISLFHVGMELGRSYEEAGDYQMAADIYRQMQDMQESLRYTTSSWLMLDYKSEQNEKADTWQLHTQRVVIYGVSSIIFLVIVLTVIYVSLRAKFKRYRRMMDLALLRNLGLRGEEVISRAQEESQQREQKDVGQHDETIRSSSSVADKLMSRMESLGNGDDIESVMEEMDFVTESYAKRKKYEEDSVRQLQTDTTETNTNAATNVGEIENSDGDSGETNSTDSGMVETDVDTADKNKQ